MTTMVSWIRSLLCQFKLDTHIVKGSSDDNDIGLRMRPE